MDILDKLKTLEYFVDNEYLLKYAQLVETRRAAGNRHTLTNKHHIVPRSWYKLMGKEVDNSRTNLITLTYREHVMAHYYLCLCTRDNLKYANELALIGLANRKCLSDIDRQLVKNLPLYNNIYESYVKHRKSNYQLYR